MRGSLFAHRIIIIGLPAAAWGLSGCLNATETPAPASAAAPHSGDMPLFDATSQAFSSPSPGLSPEDLEHHKRGDAIFSAKFVTAPTPVHPGLGPFFNNVSCVACHGGDGRGRPPEPGEALAGMLFRISVEGRDAHGGPKPMPGFGGQIQTRAQFGATPEAGIAISYQDSVVTFADGGTATLRVPRYVLQNPWKPLAGTPLLSPRVAPPVFGLGLLEAVSEADILSRADPDDADGDGISGRPNHVFDVRAQAMVLGRFGWKANNPNLDQQNAGAFNQDMGITNPIFPVENCAGDLPACDSNSNSLDIDSAALESVAFYLRSLAIPGRRGWDHPQVKRGEAVFAAAGCAACHVPELRTGPVDGRPELSLQTFHPYTDLLLHDMGGGLADDRPDFEADGREWRTAPLWGIGLTRMVSGHTFFLHDGRARNLMEAVLWHGGEAGHAKNAIVQATPADRQALIAFLESL